MINFEDILLANVTDISNLKQSGAVLTSGTSYDLTKVKSSDEKASIFLDYQRQVDIANLNKQDISKIPDLKIVQDSYIELGSNGKTAEAYQVYAEDVKPIARGFIAKADKNGDGVLTEEEYVQSECSIQKELLGDDYNKEKSISSAKMQFKTLNLNSKESGLSKESDCDEVLSENEMSAYVSLCDRNKDKNTINGKVRAVDLNNANLRLTKVDDENKVVPNEDTRAYLILARDKYFSNPKPQN